MNLTPSQQSLINEYVRSINDSVWEKEYYGDDTNPILTKLYEEGVEVNFEVTVRPYVGFNHPEFEG